MTTRTKQPSVLRFIVLWCAVLFVLTAGLLLVIASVVYVLDPHLFDIKVEEVPVGGVLVALCAGFYGVNAAVCGVVIGALHATLRGVLRRALTYDEATSSFLFLRYRSINLGYGIVVGAPFGVLGLCATDEPMELLYIVGFFSIAYGIASIIVGELMRPKFQMSIATEHLPPDPFPKRTLTKEEEELLNDAEEVMRRLQDNEAKRRWATLYALGQLSEAEEYILGAVTVLAAYDPMDYVREAAQSDLLVWKKSLPMEEPDADFNLTSRRLAQFSLAPDAAVITRVSSSDETIVTLEGDFNRADFVFTWAHNVWSVSAVLEKTKIQQLVWESYGEQILAELEKLKADGWEQIKEAGPSFIALRTFKKTDAGGLAAAAGVVVLLSVLPGDLGKGIGSGGGSLSDIMVEPTELRVPLRRART